MRMHVAIRCLFALVVLTMFASSALFADQNSLTLSGNVTAVSRETGPNYTIDTMTLIDGTAYFSFTCNSGQGCFDPYWLGPCTPTLTTSHPDSGVTFYSYHCAANSYRPGRCVTIDGHLASEVQWLGIVPDSVAPGSGCSW